MQGQLSEIDIRSILQLIELGQRTGELFVEAYGLHSCERNARSPAGQSWFVFFLNGQIVYAATDTDTTLLRLRDYLRRYKKDPLLDQIAASTVSQANAPEYSYLWALLEAHHLTPAQGRAILTNMVQETLFDLLSLHTGSFIFELGPALSPQLMTLEIGAFTSKIVHQIQEWKQFHPHIQSPNQCPAIANLDQLRQATTEPTYRTFVRWADGKTSIRQMSRYLNRDITAVARAIFPYIQQGLIQLTYFPGDDPVTPKRAWRDWSSQTPSPPPRVVCIDDGIALCKAVEQILKRHGYEAATISNPLKALSLVFQLKPDLILCDIAMPELDGYEICAMLRRSTRFRQTPIVMLTGKDGFIDRVKARMVGATDYLTKPFGENELLMILEKYIGVGSTAGTFPDRLLDDAIASELDLDQPEEASAP